MSARPASSTTRWARSSVPADALWGAQTARAVENFPISGQPVPAGVVHALALLKAAAAGSTPSSGVLDASGRTRSRRRRGRSPPAGTTTQFPIDVFQTGSGTSTNMNVNEVVARLAHLQTGLDIHPNDHVNAGQSSNDTFPTALRLAATTGGGAASSRRPWRTWSESLAAQGGRVRRRRQGRPHPPDGRRAGHPGPGVLRLRRARSSWAGQRVLHGRRRPPPSCRWAAPPPAPASTPRPGSPRAVIAGSRERDRHRVPRGGQPLRGPGRAGRRWSSSAGPLKVVAVSLTKICNDLRWMSSGPRAGLGEIHLPDLQPGSSIMPGKVNPVVREATLMVCAQVIGNDATITVAGASRQLRAQRHAAGDGRAVLESLTLLATTSRLLADRCVDGIDGRRGALPRLAEGSPAIVTPLNRYIGYEAAAAVAKESIKRAPRHPRRGHGPRARRRRVSSPRSSSTTRSTSWR